MNDFFVNKKVFSKDLEGSAVRYTGPTSFDVKVSGIFLVVAVADEELTLIDYEQDLTYVSISAFLEPVAEGQENASIHLLK